MNRTKKILMAVLCYNNQLSTLDVSGCTELWQLQCYNNELTSLIVQDNVPRSMIDCKNNHFLLSDLYNLSATINNNCYKYYSDQTLPLREIHIDETVDYSAEKEFDGFATDFYVSKLGNDGYYQTAVEDEDYNISEGVITFHTTGGYRVSMYNSQGVPNSSANPTVTATFTVGDGAGISKTEVTANITVYPNPTKDELKIESGELKVESIEIADITGKTIQQFSSVTTINVSHLSSGIYFVKIKTDKGELTKKIIKE